MNELQLFLLMQNQTMVILHGMTLTNSRKGLGRVKKEFKQMMGLSPSCSEVETLQAIGQLYAMNGHGKKFNDYVKRWPKLMDEHGIQLVTELSVVDQERRLALLN